MGIKRLFLIRHAEAEFTGHGRGDHGRILTPEGHDQAKDLGAELTAFGIEAVLASSADRATQTAHGLGLSAPVTTLDELYNGSTHSLVRALANLDEAVTTAAVVAHAPGVPALVEGLADDTSDPEMFSIVSSFFPTATAAGIEFEGTWRDVRPGRLFWARRG